MRGKKFLFPVVSQPLALCLWSLLLSVRIWWHSLWEFYLHQAVICWFRFSVLSQTVGWVDIAYPTGSPGLRESACGCLSMKPWLSSQEPGKICGHSWADTSETIVQVSQVTNHSYIKALSPSSLTGWPEDQHLLELISWVKKGAGHFEE